MISTLSRIYNPIAKTQSETTQEQRQNFYRHNYSRKR